MCPDKQILSALYDGEIPEPWNTRIREHVSDCSACAERMNSFKKISLAMEEDVPEMDLSAARVWTNLAKAGESRSQRSDLWHRRIAIPAPLLAAAALLVFLGAGFFVGISRQSPVQPSSPDVWTVQFEDHNLEELADLLKERDDQVQVFIELPKGSSLVSPDLDSSAPQLLRAADYRR